MNWTDEDKALAAGMKRAGMTTKQIAARLGRSVPDVRKQCRASKAFCHLDHRPGCAKMARPKHETLEELDMK